MSLNDVYVIDASAVGDLINRKSASSIAEEIFSKVAGTTHVPHLCDIEVTSSIRKLLIAGEITEREALDRLTQYASLPIERHGHLGLLPAILSRRKNFTAYDACYVALAERLQASLVTADLKLARGVRQHTEVPVIALKG